MEKVLYLVIPCYNEEEVLLETCNQLEKILNLLIKKKKIANNSKILFVDDGSKDKTWDIIQNKANNKEKFAGVKLSRNKGHQNALLAGLMVAKEKADMVISMDADLQDDVKAINLMIDEYLKGYEIVYGVRKSRKKDTFFKRFTAQSFYKLMKVLGVDLVYNHADFRLMSKRVLECLDEYQEVHLFLRGIIPQIGFKNTIVYYERKERFAGKSKYPLKKMLSFAFDGITSFSVKPLRFIFYLGLFILIFSIVIMIYSLVMKVLGHTVAGWTFIILSIWMLGGIQMVSIGVLGEYIGKVYSESKKRPRYFVEEVIDL